MLVYLGPGILYTVLEGILLLGLGLFCWDRLKAGARKDKKATLRAFLAERNGERTAYRWNKFVEEHDA